MIKTILCSQQEYERWVKEREAELMTGDQAPRQAKPKQYPCVMVWERTAPPWTGSGFPPVLYATAVYSHEIPLPYQLVPKKQGTFSLVAAAMDEAKHEHRALVDLYFTERASNIEKLVREEIFNHMMKHCRGRFDPVVIRGYVNMEFSPM